jgi:hypothetical protein
LSCGRSFLLGAYLGFGPFSPPVKGIALRCGNLEHEVRLLSGQITLLPLLMTSW